MFTVLGRFRSGNRNLEGRRTPGCKHHGCRLKASASDWSAWACSVDLRNRDCLRRCFHFGSGGYG